MVTAKALLGLADAQADLSLRCAPDFTSPENTDYLLVFENFTFTVTQH